MKDTYENNKAKNQLISNDLADEFTYIWTHCNIPFLSRKTMVNKFSKLITDFETLKRWPEVRRTQPAYIKKVADLKKILQNGVDIFSSQRIIVLESDLGVDYGDEEKALYKDNCQVDEASGFCKRGVWCGGTDKKWLKKAIERKNKLERKEYIARKEIEKYRESMDRLKEEMKVVSVDEVDCDQHDEETVPESSDDQEYQPAKTAHRNSSIVDTPNTSDIKTRLSMQRESEVTVQEASKFPELPIRTGLKTFDMTIIETLVIMESKFKVDARKARELLAYIGNTIFQQKWTVAAESKDGSVEVGVENEEMNDNNEPKKKRRKLSNLTYQLPDRSTVAAYLSDFALLSFTDMAERMVEAKEERKSITYGVDDTVKAAGFRRHDVKNIHVTILDDEKNRETFTSGFYPNASHTGKDAAETVKHDVAKMAVLTNNTYREMLSLVDFFMTDRDGSSDKMLDELDVSPSRRLKCNAHVLLATDVAIDKVFKDVEGIVGVANLVGRGAAHVFNSPKNSVWFLGLIALAKLLSPSHSAESISLYTAYTKFLNDLNCDLKNDFKGFISNRFGRIGELSNVVQKHLPYIRQFFDEQVNEHSNKLVLAVYTYTQSQWFLTCCNVAASFYHKITIPIKKLIGMDEFKGTKSDKRSWKGIKSEFQDILSELKRMSKEASSTDGVDCLLAKAADGIFEALERQLSVVSFFTDTESKSDLIAPLTNLGCESNFSGFGNDCKESGGATKLETISNKAVIAKNQLYAK